MKILAIDPGNMKSGWCLYDTSKHTVCSHGIYPNDDIFPLLQNKDCDLIAIEMIASYGMPVGATVFETCVWIGRYIQASEMPCKLIYRKDVKMHLCGTPRAKDGNIRQAIIDLFPATGGGKNPQIGIKGQQGPLYGVSSDIWAAVGVALIANQQLSEGNNEQIKGTVQAGNGMAHGTKLSSKDIYMQP